jgi:hypothetical protein
VELAQPPPPAPPAPPVPAPVDTRAPAQPPWLLVAALALLTVGGFILGMVFARYLNGGDPIADFQTMARRLRLLDDGLDVAVCALLLAGALDLRRRATDARGSLGAKLVLGAVIAIAVVTVVRMSISRFDFLFSSGSAGWQRELFLWTGRLWAAAWLTATAGFIVMGWGDRRTRLLAGPAIVASLLAQPFDLYATHIYTLLGTGYGYSIVGVTLDVAYIAVVTAILWRSAPPVERDGGWHRGAAALDRAASALYARLWIAGIAVVMVLILFGSQGKGAGGLAKLWAVGVPLANAVTGLLLASGILGAAGMTARGVPRVRLAIAGTLMVALVAIGTIQVGCLMKLVFGTFDDDGYGYYDGGDREELAAVAQALPVLLPVLLAITYAALAMGLHGLARAIARPNQMDEANKAIWIVIVTQALAIGIPYLLATSRNLTPGMAIMGMVVVLACAIASVLVLARLCRALAAEIRTASDLSVF